jgi:hypothetical protein
MDYDSAVAELYRSPLAEFVATRKRLAAELKPADKAQAKRFEKLARPSISAWAVNQLWWRARPSFDALLDAAARLRAGDATASTAHRASLSELRKRAAEILAGDAHAASDAVLRRVTHTLSALALTGCFAPDPPGALVQDRDPPGFEAMTLPLLASASQAAQAPLAADRAAAEHARTEREQRERVEQQRARVRAERERLEAELRQAEAAAGLRIRDVERARQALADAERELVRAQAAVTAVRSRLADGEDDRDPR